MLRNRRYGNGDSPRYRHPDGSRDPAARESAKLSGAQAPELAAFGISPPSLRRWVPAFAGMTIALGGENYCPPIRARISAQRSSRSLTLASWPSPLGL